ncbi:MAG: YkgJ family cysteine cluster protein [Spirochaetia bacterium]|jgi:Fe-S-cluster containining protein
MAKDVFYNTGLRFACTRCSKCCRLTPGYVFLSEADIAPLVAALGVERQAFFHRYCRRVRFGPVLRLSLREKPNVDCILWENGGCSVYEARPLQCRSFPFWSSCLSSPEEWQHHARQCPGIGTGPLHSRQEIEKWLAQRMKEPFIEVGGVNA